MPPAQTLSVHHHPDPQPCPPGGSSLTGAGVLLVGDDHGPGVELLQLPVQLLQLAAGGPQLPVHVGGALAVGHGAPQPLRRLLDLQLALDLLAQQGPRVVQALLERRVQDVVFLGQAMQTGVLKTRQSRD